MEQYYSKKSSLRDNVMYEPLDRGHHSEITRVKKANVKKASNVSARRMFTFVGSAAKRAPPEQTKSRTPKILTPKPPTPHRSRSRSTLKNKIISSLQKSSKDRSRSASHSSSREQAPAPSRPVTPIPVEIPAPPKDTISPTVLVDDQPKIEIKNESVTSFVSSVSSSEDENEEEEDVSSSPSIVGYRKLVYNEPDGKWIEYWKLEEDLKRAQKKKKAQKIIEKWQAHKTKPKIHPVKGRITAKIQVMFPTAIVKQDKRNRQYYQSILMTDPLRIELHKRRAPIVPTYYQEHIVKYGKLPFRNNPRPHPIV